MSDKTDAWMPLWIGAYLADTMRLSTLQHGAYLLLLMAYWRQGSALPDDDEELRSITKADKSEWKRLRPVLEKFFRVSDGIWWHKRVESELAGAAERSTKSKEKAARAAQARWKDRPKDASSNAPSNAPSTPQAVPEDMHDECPTPSPTPSSLRSEEESNLRLLVPDAEKPASADPPGKAGKTLPDCPAADVVALYHEVLPELPRVERLTDARRAHIRQRWREWAVEKGWRTPADGLEDWRKFFDFVRDSPFLMGRVKPRESGRAPFVADIDFLMAAGSHTKIFEGKYHASA